MKKRNALQARIENFENIVEQYEKEGYSHTEVKINIVSANIKAILLIILTAVLFGIPFGYVHGIQGSITISSDVLMLSSLSFLGIYLLTLVLHEGLHGFGFSLFCKKHLKSIQFGVIWKYLTPYCSCMEPLNWKPYLFGGLLPFLVLGIGFFIVAMVNGSFIWLLFAILNVGGAGGDLIVAYHIVKDRPILLMDLPQDCGYLYFYKK